MAETQRWQALPTQLERAEFEQFVLPHLSIGSRGPAPKLSLYKIFNYVLKILYLGCQWKELPIRKDGEGHPETHYTRISREVGMDLQGTIVSLDGVYDCRANRKAIFNRGMVPNINPNPRGRKQPMRGRKPIFEPAIFKERFWTIERVFAWEDKFRRLLLRFERISGVHYAFKTLAYTMINLRHYCQI
jgi:transposase